MGADTQFAGDDLVSGGDRGARPHGYLSWCADVRGLVQDDRSVVRDADAALQLSGALTASAEYQHLAEVDRGIRSGRHLQMLDVVAVDDAHQRLRNPVQGRTCLDDDDDIES
ncbi:MAG: hypothetical protein O3C33_10830 [Actinomycetota bacterium]|nr:hypothetical protein [Actinomycetota bacterium]